MWEKFIFWAFVFWAYIYVPVFIFNEEKRWGVFKLAGGSLRFMKIDWLALVSSSGPGEEHS